MTVDDGVMIVCMYVYVCVGDEWFGDELGEGDVKVVRECW
jgi:hypothetical protein